MERGKAGERRRAGRGSRGAKLMRTARAEANRRNTRERFCSRQGEGRKDCLAARAWAAIGVVQDRNRRAETRRFTPELPQGSQWLLQGSHGSNSFGPSAELNVFAKQAPSA